MRRAMVWEAVCLGLVVTGSSVGRAQGPGADVCERVCSEREASCITACGEHDDPIECEAACRDAAAACERECEDES